MPRASSASSGEVIAFYGTLMRGLGDMADLGLGETLRYIGPCLIEGQLFDLGAYPGLRAGIARVVGEIHLLLDPDALAVLDSFEGYDEARPEESLYLRERVRLVQPASQEAWLYVYNRVPDPGCRIESGDWRAHQAAQTRAT